MNVSACLVTDGKHDMQPVLDSLPEEWQKIIWNNGEKRVTILYTDEDVEVEIHRIPCEDLSVYGRYAAIEYATNELVYVQDDDVIVSGPQKIVDAWINGSVNYEDGYPRFPGIYKQDHVVCNMPPEFRPHYPDSALVGFGAVFHRDAPEKAFDQFHTAVFECVIPYRPHPDEFNRECDRVFTCLTPRVLVDIPKTDRDFASDPDRLWRQDGHVASTQRMLELARKVRDQEER